MLVIRMRSAKDIDRLLTAAADYEKFLAQGGHCMRYISNTPAQNQRAMLGTIGAPSIEDLLRASRPRRGCRARSTLLPGAMAELDLVRHLQRLAARNAGADDYACFLGGGAYDHSSRARSTT